jgi:hypothetical protein
LNLPKKEKEREEEKRKKEEKRVAELAYTPVPRPRDPGSYLGTDRKYFLILFLSNLNLNL